MTTPPRGAVTVAQVRSWKHGPAPFAMLTAYDATTAEILSEAGIPLLLVGDSVGDNVLGHATTVPVTLEDMLHHTGAVVRGATGPLVIADLPFGSYQVDVTEGMRAALRLVKEGGAHAVKAEGGERVVDLARRLVEAGVPFMGHLGLTPQSVHEMGYRVQGREPAAAERILADASALEEAGAFAIVLEGVPASLGKAVTAAVGVPTIGIGAGADTDGQVLVVHDLLGLGAGPPPSFVKAYADLRGTMAEAVRAFADDVAAGAFPGPAQRYE
ncbi:MAG: 3-methyl-2-oxobutanoate hydroxymethyltransferase [Actinomycetota bacterium]